MIRSTLTTDAIRSRFLLRSLRQAEDDDEKMVRVDQRQCKAGDTVLANMDKSSGLRAR